MASGAPGSEDRELVPWWGRRRRCRRRVPHQRRRSSPGGGIGDPGRRWEILQEDPGGRREILLADGGGLRNARILGWRDDLRAAAGSQKSRARIRSALAVNDRKLVLQRASEPSPLVGARARAVDERGDGKPLFLRLIVHVDLLS